MIFKTNDKRNGLKRKSDRIYFAAFGSLV